MKKNNEQHRLVPHSTTGVIRFSEDVAIPRVSIDVNFGDASKYYRELFRIRTGIQLIAPRTGPHITVLSSEPRNTFIQWGWMRDQEVNVNYGNGVFWDSYSVWVPAHCVEIEQIRRWYGVAAKDRGHITIGKFKTPGVYPEFKNYSDLEDWPKWLPSPV